MKTLVTAFALGTLLAAPAFVPPRERSRRFARTDHPRLHGPAESLFE